MTCHPTSCLGRWMCPNMDSSWKKAIHLDDAFLDHDISARWSLGCFGRVVIHLCRAMSWRRRKDRLHVSQVKGCQVSPSVGCFPLLAALLVALLCSSSCSLLLVLFSRPLCHSCLHSALSCASVYQVLSSMPNFLRSFLTLSRHLIFVRTHLCWCTEECWHGWSHCSHR